MILRVLTFLLAFQFIAAPAWGAYVLIDKVSIGNTAKDEGAPGATSAAIITTGANFIVCMQTYYGGYDGTPTDSKGNTYTGLANNQHAETSLRGYISISPTVGAGHTFTTGGWYASMICSAWSGAHATTPTDQQRADAHTPFSANLRDLATGAITPTEDGELIIVGCAIHDLAASSGSIDSGFTILEQVNMVATGHEGSFAAYLIQTTATAVNPICSWAGQNDVTASIYSFKVPAAGGAPNAQYRRR